MTERELEILVAAFYDGELSSGKRRVVADLLRQDDRAARYLLDLQNLGRQLRALPFYGKPANLSLKSQGHVEANGLDPGDFLFGLANAPEQVLAAHADGSLSSTQRTELEAWLQSQPNQRLELESLQRSRTALAALPRLAMPKQVGDSIRNAIRAEAGRMAADRAAAKAKEERRPKSSTVMPNRWSFGEVLTSYLDGELPARRQRMVERALARSKRGRLFLRHHAEIKQLLGELSVQKLDRDTFRSLVDEAVGRTKVGDRTGAVIAAAAETVPKLSHDLPRPGELPAPRTPASHLLGFRWTSYVAFAASVVLVLAFAELAFNRTGLLNGSNGRFAIHRRNAADPGQTGPAESKEILVDSSPLQGSLPDRSIKNRETFGGDNPPIPEPELAIDALADVPQRKIVSRLDGKQIRLSCKRADEIYSRFFLALRQDGISLPAKLAIPDRRPLGNTKGQGAIAVDLSLTAKQWHSLFAMLRQIERGESLIASVDVTAPSKEILAVIRQPSAPTDRPEVVIVPSLVVGSGPLANRGSIEDFKPRGLNVPPDISKNQPSKDPTTEPKASKARLPGEAAESPMNDSERKVRVVVIFEEFSR